MSPVVALIDSGVNWKHPHIQESGSQLRCWRAQLDEESRWEVVPMIGSRAEQLDLLGHGTAAAAAILDLAPGSRIESIQVFHRDPTAVLDGILCALDHALVLAPDLCNLSLGTTSEESRAPLVERVARFSKQGIPLVSPSFWRNLPSYPGCLEGCTGVRIDPSLERAAPEQRKVGGRTDWFASPYPRDLPGLPRTSNLAGASMACANLSGYLAKRAMEDRQP